MKNIYDDRKERGLYAILSDEILVDRCVEQSSTAIFAYFYYDDSVERYGRYIESIPEDIVVYIISPKAEILSAARHTYNRKKIFFVEKENRGRDVSALCVACREFTPNYKYVCFLHDKKEHYTCEKKKTNIWIDNLWGNMIGNAVYIENVLSYLADHKKVGLLLPMEPIQAYTDGNWWGENYTNTVRVAKKIGVDSDLIREDRAAISIGTVFWARTEALEKLINYSWLYEDFAEEPMPMDGTISHAIERVLPYVAQDAGYETYMVMSSRFAASVIAELYDDWLVSGTYLRGKLGVRSVEEIPYIDEMNDSVKEYCDRHERNYIYGAGRYALDLKNVCDHYQIPIEGCVVKDMNHGVQTVSNISILEFGRIDLKNCGVMVAVNASLQREVIEQLTQAGLKDLFIYKERAVE